MPIYEFACPNCRKIFSFLSKRLQPKKTPACPKCGNRKLTKQMSAFAMTRGTEDPSAAPESEMPDPRMMRAMADMERDLAHIDDNNPKHLAHMMKKMRDMMPGAAPKELNDAIKRLESGEDPEKVEAEMGDLLGDFMGESGGTGSGGGYTKDSGLYDY